MYKLVIRVIQYFCFPDRPMKSGDILDFWKGGNLREGGGMTPLTNYVINFTIDSLTLQNRLLDGTHSVLDIRTACLMIYNNS